MQRGGFIMNPPRIANILMPPFFAYFSKALIL